MKKLNKIAMLFATAALATADGAIALSVQRLGTSCGSQGRRCEQQREFGECFQG